MRSRCYMPCGPYVLWIVLMLWINAKFLCPVYAMYELSIHQVRSTCRLCMSERVYTVCGLYVVSTVNGQQVKQTQLIELELLFISPSQRGTAANDVSTNTNP